MINRIKSLLERAGVHVWTHLWKERGEWNLRVHATHAQQGDPSLNLKVSGPSMRCGASVGYEADSEHTLSASFMFPPASLFLCLESHRLATWLRDRANARCPKCRSTQVVPDNRRTYADGSPIQELQCEGGHTWSKYRSVAAEWSLNVHDWAVWWRLGQDPGEWHSSTPKWRDGCFRILPFPGSRVGDEQVLATSDEVLLLAWNGAVVPHRCRVTLSYEVRRHQRFPLFTYAQRVAWFDFTPNHGAYDPVDTGYCSKGPIHGMGVQADSIPAALEAMQTKVLKERMENGYRPEREAARAN